MNEEALAEKRKRLEAAKEAENYVCEQLKIIKRDWNITRPYHRYASLDGVVYSSRTKEMLAVFDVKARNTSLVELINQHGYHMMVDASKIDSMKSASRVWRVPGYIYFYLMKDGVIWEQQITDENGDPVPYIKTQDAKGPKNLGGEMVLKKIAEIPFDGGKMLKTDAKTGKV